MYIQDWTHHTKEELIVQVISVIIILILGMFAIRILGKKSIAQMTLTDVLFIFVLSSTLGALITNPQRIFVAFMVVVTIVLFVLILAKIPLKFNKLERFFTSTPEIIYKNGQFNENALRRNNVTVDMIESYVRARGYPSIEICKTVVIEPTGTISFEVLPQYENAKWIQLEDAFQQVLKAINDSEYVNYKMPKMTNPFEEIEGGRNAHKKKVPKHLE